MQRLDEIAKRYNATIDRFRGPHVATIPVQCHEKVDDGDETGGERFFGKLAAAAGRLSALGEQNRVDVSSTTRARGPAIGNDGSPS